LVDELNLESRASHLNLRDSVSTVVSSEQRSVGSLVDANTPTSSPASSVIVTGRKDSSPNRVPPLTSIKTRSSSRLSGGASTSSTTSTVPRRSLLPRKSHFDLTQHSTPPRSSIGTPNRSTSSMATRTPSRALQWPSRPEPTPQAASKGRFVTAVKAEVKDFRPLSAFEPSPYAKAPVTPRRYHRVTSAAPGGLNGSGTPSSVAGGGERSNTPASSRIVSAPEKTTSSIPTPASSARMVSTGNAAASSSSLYRSPAPRASLPAPTTTPRTTSRLGLHRPSMSALRPTSRLARGSTTHREANGVNGHTTNPTHITGPNNSNGTASSEPARNFLYPRIASRNAGDVLQDAGNVSGGDGNEADNESPTHHHRMRPPSRGGRVSAMGGAGGGSGRSSALGLGRARSRMEMTGEGADEAGRPKWRP
jgi:hypothetical protein